MRLTRTRQTEVGLGRRKTSAGDIDRCFPYVETGRRQVFLFVSTGPNFVATMPTLSIFTDNP